MRVYFTGCHGSGKTTCARYVAEKYQLPLVTEVARMVLSEKELQVDTLRHNIDLVDNYQTEVFKRQLFEETKYTNFVSDRSAIDTLAYSGQHTRILPKLFNSDDLKKYVALLKSNDSIIFFVRSSTITLRADGVREQPTLDGALAIDAQIKILHEIFDLRYFQISTSSMQERVKLIDAVLSLMPSF